MKKLLDFLVIAVAMNTAWGATCAELNPEMTNADWENGVVYGPITVKEVSVIDVDDPNKCVAEVNGDATESIPLINNVKVDSIYYSRLSGTRNVYQTITLPFSPSLCYSEGIEFYTLNSVDCETSQDGSKKWVVKYGSNQIKNFVVKPNTPYLARLTKMDGNNKNLNVVTMTKNESKECRNENNSKTICSCPEIVLNTSATQTTRTDDGWEFHGTYESMTWAENNEDLGKIYGFAGTAENNIKVGTFVKAGAGANILPMRAYLKYNPPIVAAKAAPGALASIGVEDLPDYIEVVAEDEGGTTVIATIKNPDIKMIQDNHWVDMKGRKFDGKPQNAGTYYNQGKKVIIK